MEAQLAGWTTYYDPASRRHFFVEFATGRSQREDPRASDFPPPYQVDPLVPLPGLSMQLPPLPIPYSTTASNRSPAHQISSERVAAMGGGMAIAPPLTVLETVVSEYAKHGKKYGKSRKHRKHSWDEADDDRKGGIEANGRKDGKVEKENKKKQKEEEELDFLEILAELF
ncbi:MAG: hypothetical protein BYD32DRAFT_434502 [Podila humilis]|nr:MAG: hypothetical protein BYD32DRAFT_434502 [Podila humilis]